MKINTTIELTAQNEKIAILEDDGILIPTIKRKIGDAIKQSFKNDNITVSKMTIEFKVHENSLIRY